MKRNVRNTEERSSPGMSKGQRVLRKIATSFKRTENAPTIEDVGRKGNGTGAPGNAAQDPDGLVINSRNVR
jgi:hypothetical protein